ncbi:MAG TPA: hypothetical protein VGS41_19170, partial [Chthonomonadales bacterium]|nr:hypothetical protein [Chthonomonadales bacterium]
QTYLYSPDGQLLFSGGITSERGHTGDCDALDAVIAITRGARPAHVAGAPVFGCTLLGLQTRRTR